MKTAAVDIGTNSVRLLVSDSVKGKLYPLVRLMHITRLGEKIGKKNIVSEAAADRTVDILEKYKEIMQREGVQKYRAVGTDALRKAKNSQWFIDYAYGRTGIKIEIISGKQEAALSYSGAVSGLQEKRNFSPMVVDIGGGSTELILGRGKSPDNIISIGLGCVSLTETFGQNYSGMEQWSKDFIKNNVCGAGKEKIDALIGLGGTITTLAAVDLQLEKYDRTRTGGHQLRYKDIIRIYDVLRSKGLEERKKIKGLDPQRADIIIGGTVILISILDYFNQKRITVSENDILDGIIYSLFDFC